MTPDPQTTTPAKAKRTPAKRFVMLQTITPTEDSRAPHQYVEGGEYEDAFVAMLWMEGSEALEPVVTEVTSGG